MSFWKDLIEKALPDKEPAPVELPFMARRTTKLHDAKAFYDRVRKFKLFGPTFNQSEFQGCEEILADCGKAGWPVSWVAYALATAYHETAGTMQPIKEYGGYDYYMRMYDITGKNASRARKMGNTLRGDGARYCGRGYVQLTWKVNYTKAADKLGVDFVNNPDLAMIPDHAADIMVRGMEEGWFTGKSLKSYLPTKNVSASHWAFRNSRRIINGLDKASMIGYYARDFQSALVAGGWR